MTVTCGALSISYKIQVTPSEITLRKLVYENQEVVLFKEKLSNHFT